LCGRARGRLGGCEHWPRLDDSSNLKSRIELAVAHVDVRNRNSLISRGWPSIVRTRHVSCRHQERNDATNAELWQHGLATTARESFSRLDSARKRRVLHVGHD